MPQLKKASLVEITSEPIAKQLGTPIDVQFNPTSLKLNVTNAIEGAVSRGRQARQYIGASSSSLSMDLVFDTADEGSTESPRSVAEKIAMVERFVLPKEIGKDKQSVPKLRFQWGKLIFDGVANGIDIDFEHFAADGTPLRAKVRLQIKEQLASYQLLETGPGAARKGSAALPGAVSFGAGAQASAGFSAGAGIGAGASFGAGASAGFGAQVGGQVGVALAGETAAEFAARVGVDPSAWRGLQADLSAGLSLEAGAEVGFDLGLSANGGLGLTVGAEASAEVSVEAAFGLGASGGAGSENSSGGISLASQAEAERQAGFALAAAGGVAGALASVENHHATAAANQGRAAFTRPTTAAGATAAGATPATEVTPAPFARPSGSHQERSPLRESGRAQASRPAAETKAQPAPAPPRADRRAGSFGRGVPLRPVRGAAAEQRALGGDAPLRAVPTVPPWQALPAHDAGRQRADEIQGQRRPSRPCGCACDDPFRATQDRRRRGDGE